ncbi:MAG: nucleotidyltransferase family protein [Clostridia bacterium]|nr:nucleotidyltransferase family protein [Clostridia bacterium]
MDLFQQQALALIRGALKGEKCTLPEAPDMDGLLKLASKHKIAALMYYALHNAGYDNDPVTQQLFFHCCRYMAISEGQMAMLGRVTAAFEERHIDYLPLKGVLLKEIYPRPEMRRMGDADILFRREQYEDIKVVLTELGFSFDYETDHEAVWKHPSLLLEMHKRIVPRRDKDLYRYFGNGWSHAIANEDNPYRYHFTLEMQFVSLFIHLVKHYRGGGIGLSHMIDLWVFRRHYPELDEAMIRAELDKVYLGEFYANVWETLQVWFEGAEATEKTDFITNVIFENGVYGTRERAHLSYVAKAGHGAKAHKNSYVTKWLHLVFPPKSALQTKYPVLRRCAVLLPVIWVVRWVDTLLFHRKRIAQRNTDIQRTNVESIEQFEQALHYVGLEYHFEEE